MYFLSVTGNQVSLKDWSMPTSEDIIELTKGGSNAKKAIQKQRKQTMDRQLLFKTKLCWFHAHHPDGCPRVADACPFAHGKEELRSRPPLRKPLVKDFDTAPVIK